MLSCSGSPRQGAGLACFPDEAARWLSDEAVSNQFAGRRDTSGPVSVYLDASGSMAGYVQGATANERPFHDLVATLPDMLRDQSTSFDYHVFGSKIRDLPSAQRANILRPGYFSCKAVSAGSCDNKETRLDVVLKDIDTQTDKLSVVVTDMWFADPGNLASGLAPLAGPLTNILASGRTIAVFGIPSPFNGTIYDLPSGQKAAFAGRKPLMLIVIGPPDRVSTFKRQLQRSPSRFLANGVADGTIRQAVFALNPASGVPRNPHPLSVGDDNRVRPATVLNATQGVRVQQFAVDRSNSIRPSSKPTAVPTWTGPADNSFIDNAVWKGPLASETIVWERRGDRCARTDWARPVTSDVGWIKNEDSQKKFELDPTSFVSQLRRPGVYLVTARVARTSVEQPNPTTQWLRDWSFTSADGAVDRRPGASPLHRTLNLAEFSRLLENALADAAERNPGPITGFTFAIEVKE